MEALMSEEQKQRILRYAESIVQDKEIMFIYYGGSIAYGFYTEGTSDLDVNVIVHGLKGYLHSNYSDCDFFIYGDNYYMKKQQLSTELPLYYKTYVDEVLGLNKTLIYLNPKYEKEFEVYKKINLEQQLKKLLDIFLRYHYGVIERQVGIPVKRLYHVLRMRGIIENYKTTGKYSLEVLEPWASLLIKYKSEWETAEGKKIYQSQILPSMEYLQNFKDQLKEADEV